MANKLKCFDLEDQCVSLQIKRSNKVGTKCESNQQSTIITTPNPTCFNLILEKGSLTWVLTYTATLPCFQPYHKCGGPRVSTLVGHLFGSESCYNGPTQVFCSCPQQVCGLGVGLLIRGLKTKTKYKSKHPSP